MLANRGYTENLNFHIKQLEVKIPDLVAIHEGRLVKIGIFDAPSPYISNFYCFDNG